MKKNLTKKLMLSVLTLAFAVVSLGASTFAWFTTSENAAVEEFTIDVTAQAGIQIAVANAEVADSKSQYYVGTLPASVVMEKIGADFKFNHVTSLKDYAVSNATFTKEFYDIKGDDENTGYVALKFFVKADASGKLTVNLPWLTNKTYDSIGVWAAGTQFTRPTNVASIAADAKYKYDARSAARMYVDFTGGAVASSPKLFQAQENTSYVEGNEYGNTLGVTAQGALEIYNEITNAKTPVVIPAGASESAEEYPTTDFKYEVDIERDVEYTLTYYIWLEGFDGECLNAIFAQVLANSISFEFDQESGNIHYHVACQEEGCGKCTDPNCDGKDSEKCPGHGA